MPYPYMPYQPMGYMTAGQSYVQRQQQMPQWPAGSSMKVNGPEAAMQYNLAPGMESPPLFDMNGRQFYVVTADSAGFKTVEPFDFCPHVDEPPETVVINGVKFDNREEYDKIAAAVAAVMEAYADGIHGPVQQAEPAAKHSAPNGD